MAYLSCIGCVQVGGDSALVGVPVTSVFVFFYSHVIFVVLALSHSTACSCLSSQCEEHGLFGLALPPFIPFVG